MSAVASIEFRTPGSLYASSDTSRLDVIHKSKTIRNEFFYLFTPWIFLVQNILLVIFFALLFVPFDESGFGYNIIVVVYVFYWVLMLCITRLVVIIHKKLKLRGYIKLNNSTYRLIFLPVFIWSCGLAFISILFVFLPANTTLWGLYPIDFLEIMVGFEIVGITFVTVWYFVLGTVHNRKREPPDATSFLNTFHESNRSVVDKQAEVIQKLQQNKETLELENERLEHLISQNEARNKPAPVNPADENKSAELTKKINQLVVRCGDLRRQLDRFEERGLDEIEHKCSQLTSQIGKLEKQIEDTESETIKLKEDYLEENKTFTELQEQLEQLKMRMMEVTGIPVQEQTIYDLDSVNRLTH